MAKRILILKNLIKNSVSAFFAAVEIHNKPNIQYRYEAVTLLMMNAWELALKAYIRKRIKTLSIFTEENKTISASKALKAVYDHQNSIKAKSFDAIKANIEKIQIYRDSITHFYCTNLEPAIFMLIAKSSINYVEFINKSFGLNIIESSRLFIMPIGFKLPFNPEDFLSKKSYQNIASPEGIAFLKDIIQTTKNLKDEGVEESVVIGFNINLESVKNCTNSDILAAITAKDQADMNISQERSIKISDKPGTHETTLSENEIRKIWAYPHKEVISWCKNNINGFKVSKKFNAIKRRLADEGNKYIYKRYLDTNNPHSPSQNFYSELALHKIKDEFEKS